MFRKSVVNYSIALLFSTVLTTAWAQTEENLASTEGAQTTEENVAETECVSQAKIDSMSDDDVDKLELPVCDEDEAATKNEVSSIENPVTEAESEVMTTQDEVAVEESSFPNANESLYEDQKPSD